MSTDVLEIEKAKGEAEIKNSLLTSWVALEAALNESQKEEGQIYYEQRNEDSLKYSLLIDTDGKRKLLLSLPGGERFKEEKTNNVHVLKNAAIQNAQGIDFSGVFIEVVLINPENVKFLYNQFNTLCVLILSKIKYDKKSNYVAVKEAMKEYRSLLTKSKEDLLTSEQIIGLLGELYDADTIGNFL